MYNALICFRLGGTDVLASDSGPYDIYTLTRSGPWLHILQDLTFTNSRVTRESTLHSFNNHMVRLVMQPKSVKMHNLL